MSARRVLASALGESALTSATDIPWEPAPMMPDVKVLKMGGQSIMDRGRQALFPIL